MNYVYPKSSLLNSSYTPVVIDESKIESLKSELQKITNSKEEIITQIEYVYRDMIKIESVFENVNTEMFLKKKCLVNFNDNTKLLEIKYEIIQVDKNNFPNLHSYHHTEEKEIHKFGNILLIKNKTFWTICVDSSDKKICATLISKVNKLI